MRTLTRLRNLTMDEVMCRSRHGALRWLDRLSPAFDADGHMRRARYTQHAKDADAGTSLRQFLDAAPHRFFSGTINVNPMDETSIGDDSWRAALLEDADRIVSGRFSLLGYNDLSFGTPIDWHLDPLAGCRAPLLHWSLINPLDAGTVGDSKVTWEINRHQWMVTLAQATVVSGERRYAEVAMERLEQWAEANPYPLGINWSSSLEVALRLISWCWTMMLLRHQAGFTPERFARWRTLACAHAAHIERFLSYYYSPNTHLTGEALGLVYAGIVFAEHPDAARWRDTGCRILSDQLDRQVDNEGAHFECATCYQRYTAEIYLHVLLLGGRNRLRLPIPLREKTARMVDYLVALQGPAGQMPNMGDADGGWLLPLVRRNASDCRGVFALAAVLFDRPDFAWAAGAAQPELLWYLGSTAVDDFYRLSPRPPVGRGSMLFASGGVAIMRTGWAPDAHQLIVDVGPLGCPVSAAHGHADLLSVQCVAFGEPYLVDAGTYCYTADTTLRNHFRGTRAHNTVTVDGRDQAEPAGPFSWHSRPSVRLKAWESTDTCDFVDATHDGYHRLPGRVEHRRRVLFLKSYGWVVVDDLAGIGEHDIEVRYHFSPRRVSCDGTWVRAEGRGGRGLWIRGFAEVPLTTEIHEGCRNPLDGWISTDYGTMQPAPTAVLRTRAACPIRITTLLLPADPLLEHPPGVSGEHCGDALVVRWPDGPTVRINSGALALQQNSRPELTA